MLRRLSDILLHEVDPRPAAVTRIGLGIAGALLAAHVWNDIRTLSDPSVLRIPVVSWMPEPSTMVADVLFACWLVATAAFAVGLLARLAGVVLVGASLFALLLDGQLYGNNQTLFMLMTGLLTLGRPSAAWSLDARWRGGGEKRTPYWPLFLVQLQIASLYAYAALAKLNPSYLSGEVLVGGTRSVGAASLGALGDPVVIGVSVAAICVEGLLAFALWHEKTQQLAFPLGLALHAVIFLTVVEPGELLRPDLFSFGVLALSAYVLFLQVPLASKRPFAALAPGSRLVVWDVHCSFCAGWIRWFDRLDLFGVLEFMGSSEPGALERAGVTAEEADRAMQLVHPRGRAEGWDAVRKALEVSPVTFLVAPVMGLWPLAPLGRRAYRRVARRRSCTVEIAPQGS